MKFITPVLMALLLASCGSTKQYPLYDGQAKSNNELSTIKPHRSFGGPGIFVKYVNDKYIGEYKAMAGYPENDQQANILLPLSFQVIPGRQKLNVGFSFSDSPNKFATVASLTATTLMTGVGIANASIVNYRQLADIEFDTKAKLTYQINYHWDEVKGVTFLINECNNQEKSCKQIDAEVDYKEYSITPGLAHGKDLLAR